MMPRIKMAVFFFKRWTQAMLMSLLRETQARQERKQYRLKSPEHLKFLHITRHDWQLTGSRLQNGVQLKMSDPNLYEAGYNFDAADYYAVETRAFITAMEYGGKYTIKYEND